MTKELPDNFILDDDYEISFKPVEDPYTEELTPEEKDVKKEAVNPKNNKETKPDSAQDDDSKKKKKGFFRRLFGKKDKE